MMNRRLAGRIAVRIALVVGAILVVLAALEIALRWRPALLGHAFANGAASKYTSGPGGIYYFDRDLGMNFMLPNDRTTMYYNGYFWRHETDALGFRNKPLHVPADVMLLGDSVVYGHGVDFEHTLGYYLEQRSGLRVTNLGRQGDCAFQQAYLLTAYLPLFKPRFIVYVFSINDIEDLYVYLPDEQMEAFIAKPVDRITYPRRTDPTAMLGARERWIRQRTLAKWASQELYVMKMFRWIDYSFRQWRRRTAALAVAEAAPPRPRRFDPDQVNNDPESLGWRYTAHAVAYMKHLADKAGARLLIAPYTGGRQLEILQSIAARHGIVIVDTASMSTGPSFHSGPAFLPNDGHLTPHGARVMADLIAAALAGSSPRSSAREPGSGRPRE